MSILANGLKNEKLETAMQKAEDAMGGSDPKAVINGIVSIAESVAEKHARETLELFEELKDETDQKVLAQRAGLRVLSSAEQKYYEGFIQAAKSNDPKQALNNLDLVMPETVFESIFEEMGRTHPLLNRLDFQFTGAAIRFVTNTNGYQEGAWGPLCAEIVQGLTAGFKVITATLYKWSAFMLVCKAMLDLGPAWLDRFVRVTLSDAGANTLEKGVVVGTGKEMPIGMNRQVGDEVTVTGGVYPEKTAIKVQDFSPATMGNLISILAASPRGNSRPVNDLIMVINPQDYYQKIGPSITMLTPSGTYARNVMPFDVDPIQSGAVPRGYAAFGMGKLYKLFLGMGMDGRIEYSDEYRFLEDERTYAIKGYANGFPADNNAFLWLDISGVQPAAYRVIVEEPAEPSSDATLSDLKIGNLTLNPAFASATTSYTATTTNATNTINAIPGDAGASIQVLVGDTEIDNGSAATWATGSNTVTVNVTAADGTTKKAYTVTVTKSQGV